MSYINGELAAYLIIAACGCLLGLVWVATNDLYLRHKWFRAARWGYLGFNILSFLNVFSAIVYRWLNN